MVLQYANDERRGRYIVMFDCYGKETNIVGNRGYHLTASKHQEFKAGEARQVPCGYRFWVPDHVQLRVRCEMEGMEAMSWSNNAVGGFAVVLKNCTEESISIPEDFHFASIEFYLTGFFHGIYCSQTWLEIYIYPFNWHEDLAIKYDLGKCHLK